MPGNSSVEKWKNVLENFPPRREYLLQAFHRLQESVEERFISPDMVEALAFYFKLTKGEVYGTLTYYTLFSDRPRKPIIVQVCNSPLCHAMDKHKWIDQIFQIIDKDLHIEETACLGHCEKAPVVAVNGKIFSLQEVHSMEELLTKIKTIAHEQ